MKPFPHPWLLGFLLTALAFAAGLPADPPPASTAPSPAAPTQPTPGAVPADAKAWVVALLVRPADVPALRPEELAPLQQAHLDNIARLKAEGKIRLSGPFQDHSGRNVRGMFVLATDDLATAQAWVQTDPAVQAGRLRAEYFLWYLGPHDL